LGHENRTLADVIRDHEDCVVAGERLAARVVENDRKMAEHYRTIRDALSKRSMSDAAILDESTRHVYVMTSAGVVGRFRLIPASEIPAGDGAPDACGTVTVGEAS
jgi:hypothetical protein